MSDVNIVKVLRQKCNEIEDKIDSATETKNEALEAKEALAEELAALRSTLADLRQRQQREGSPAGQGAEKDLPKKKQRGKGKAKSKAQGEADDVKTKEDQVQKLQVAIAQEKEKQQQHQQGLAALTTVLQDLEAGIEDAASLGESLEQDLAQQVPLLDAARRAASDAAQATATEQERVSSARQASAAELQRCRDAARQAEARRARAQEETDTLQRSFAATRAKIVESEKEVQARLGALASHGDSRVAGLNTGLTKLQKTRGKQQRQVDDVERGIGELEAQIKEATCASEELTGRLSKVAEEVNAVKGSSEDATERAAQTEADLADEKERQKALRAKCVELAAARDLALETMQGADDERDQLDARLQSHEERLAALEGGNENAGEVELSRLRTARGEEETKMDLCRKEEEEAEGVKEQLQKQVETMRIARSELEGALAELQEQLSESKAKLERAAGQTLQFEADLGKEVSNLAAAREDYASTQQARDQADARLSQAKQGLAREASRAAAVMEQLAGERLLQQKEKDALGSLEAAQREVLQSLASDSSRAEQLASDLAAARGQRAEEAETCVALRRRREDLVFDRDRRATQRGEVTEKLERERALRAGASARHAELAASSDSLQAAHAAATAEAAGAASKRAEEQESCAAAARSLQEMQEELSRLAGQREACEAAHARAVAAAERAREGREAELRRVSDLLVRLDEVAPAQQELRSKHDGSLSQLDALRQEKDTAEAECQQLHAELREARLGVQEQARLGREEAQRALQEAGPTQLSKGDVIISISFEDLQKPLDVLPTEDFETVASKWLADVQRSSKLQPSLVRYLRHLETSAQTFPVRVPHASLLEVHQEFAM